MTKEKGETMKDTNFESLDALREIVFSKINNSKLNIDYNLKDSDKSLRN